MPGMIIAALFLVSLAIVVANRRANPALTARRPERDRYTVCSTTLLAAR